jgi:hypothetical protein
VYGAGRNSARMPLGLFFLGAASFRNQSPDYSLGRQLYHRVTHQFKRKQARMTR